MLTFNISAGPVAFDRIAQPIQYFLSRVAHFGTVRLEAHHGV